MTTVLVGGSRISGRSNRSADDDMLDVCVFATFDAPDPMKHLHGAWFHQFSQHCRRRRIRWCSVVGQSVARTRGRSVPQFVEEPG
jgi:hypothetical protein